jgi:hypothetical protein
MPILTQPQGAVGNVLGPGASTDNALSRWDGTDGKRLQNSGAILDDSDNLTLPGTINGVVITAHATRHRFNGADPLTDVGRVVLPTDDLATLLNAATGGEVFILAEGTHNISTGVAWTGLTNVSLVGRVGSVINWTGTGTFLTVSNCSRIKMQSLVLQLGGAAANVGVEFTGADCSDCRVTGVDFIGTTAQAHTGIYYHATAGVRNRFEDCNFSGTYQRAVNADTLTDSMISRNIVYSPTGEGIYLDDPTRVSVDENHVYSAGGPAIYIFASARAIADMRINDNEVVSPTTSGISVVGTAGLKVSNIVVTGNNLNVGAIATGVSVTYCDHSSISANVIFGQTSSGSIYLDNCTVVTMASNTISKTIGGAPWQNGVNLVNTCAYITISANTFVYGNVAVMLNSASHVTITANQMYFGGEWVKGTSPTDLTISANDMQNGGIPGISISTSGTRIAITGNRISGGTKVIDITGGANVVITGNEIANSFQEMITMPSATDLVISGNTFDTIQNSGKRIAIVSGTRISVTGNIFRKARSNALEISGDELTISDNTFETTQANAIAITASSSRVSIVKNIIKGAFADAINVAVNLTDGVIADNVIYSPGSEGIYLDDPLRVVVKGNQIYSSGSHGIAIFTSSRAASDLVIADNNVTGATSRGISIVGTAAFNITDCVISGNKSEGSTHGLYLSYVKETGPISGRYKSVAGIGAFDDANCDQLQYDGIHVRGSATPTSWASPNRDEIGVK